MKRHLWVYRLILIVVAIALLIPILVTLVYSFTTSWAGVLPSGFTLRYWRHLLFEYPEFWMAMGRSLLISVFPIFISGLCVILAMYAAILYYPKLDTLIQGICMIPFTLRGVVLAISVLGLYAGKGTIFSNRILMLVSIYCVVILPYIYRGIRNNLYAVNVQQLIEAAEILGASKLYAFFRVVVPNMLSGILVSALLALSSIFTDYAVIKIVVGSRYITAQTELYQLNRSVGGPLTSAVVMVMFCTTLLISVASYAFQNRSRRRTTMKTTEE